MAGERTPEPKLREKKSLVLLIAGFQLLFYLIQILVMDGFTVGFEQVSLVSQTTQTYLK